MIPKKWRSARGELRHLISIIKRTDGPDIVVSRYWRKHRQSWEYAAETGFDVCQQIRIVRKMQEDAL